MTSDIIPGAPPQSQGIQRLPETSKAGKAAIETAQALALDAYSPATLRAYKSDWKHYRSWCEQNGFTPMPAEPATIGAYMAGMQGDLCASTIQRRLSAIGKAHSWNGLPWNPAHRDIRDTLRGILRQQRAPVRRADAMTMPILRRLVDTCDLTAMGRRDRAMLLIGYAGALRRSELVSLRAEDVRATAHVLKVHLRFSKTDQGREGDDLTLSRGKQLATCPVRAFADWQAVAVRRTGPLFRRVNRGDRIGSAALDAGSFGRILARRLALAGVLPEEAERLTAHSLRAGFITAVYNSGARDADIMAHTRHRDPKSMRGYIRRGSTDENGVASLAGL